MSWFLPLVHVDRQLNGLMVSVLALTSLQELCRARKGGQGEASTEHIQYNFHLFSS